VPKFVILGQVGLSHILCDVISEMHGPDAVVGYIDETPEKLGQVVGGKPVLGGFDWFSDNDPHEFQAVIALSPQSKKIMVEKALAVGLEFPNLIHPRAWVSPSASMGRGNIVLQNAVIQVEARIRDFNLFHVASQVGHYAEIGSYCFLAPHVRMVENSGMGDGVFMGTNCTAVGGAQVGSWATVGAHAVVMRDVAPHTTVMGIPAVVKLSKNRKGE
jgi:sugar O-acyltransferase (sialic acid O-acetyltransferase NeuD family)